MQAAMRYGPRIWIKRMIAKRFILRPAPSLNNAIRSGRLLKILFGTRRWPGQMTSRQGWARSRRRPCHESVRRSTSLLESFFSIFLSSRRTMYMTAIAPATTPASAMTPSGPLTR